MSHERLSDDRLARAAAQGEPDAFGEIYARYNGALYGYCLSILHDAEDARDALQSHDGEGVRGRSQPACQGRAAGLAVRHRPQRGDLADAGPAGHPVVRRASWRSARGRATRPTASGMRSWWPI